MKIIYSYLQKLLPDLKIDPKKLANDLSYIGHMTSSLENINNEYVYDLEIRQNRGECLGYYGIALDLSALYNLPIKNLGTDVIANPHLPSLPISITATKEVKRIMAVKISNVKNSPSPTWLQKFCALHQINSINTLVDLTNYAMFMYGIPNHAFDTAKSTDNLVWELNTKYSEFTTLDNTTLKLKPGILMVNNPTSSLSLSFLGGQACAIDQNSTDIVIEMAVYDRVRVRQDSRFLKTTTEASTRLEKDLDPELIPQAFSFLAAQIIEICGGQISSQVFDHYPHKQSPTEIDFDPHRPTQVSGINIPFDFAIDTLKKLTCQLTPNGNIFKVLPPTIRKDITLEEDLIEEIVRLYGYAEIPSDTPISSNPLPNITPKVLETIENLKDILVKLGYDEIRAWPLVSDPIDKSTAIYTQNSINSDFPVLRQSMIQTLKVQIDQYGRLKLFNTPIFEVGKIFSEQKGKYTENYAIGIYHPSPSQLKKDLDSLNIDPNQITIQNNYAEIILDNLIIKSDTPHQIESHAYELTSQIITLDANVLYDQKQNKDDLISHFISQIPDDILWQIVVTDEFFDDKQNKYRYTFHVSYFNCDDKTAKSLHLKTFNLGEYIGKN